MLPGLKAGASRWGFGTEDRDKLIKRNLYSDPGISLSVEGIAVG